jgi:hypothetical protein
MAIHLRADGSVSQVQIPQDDTSLEFLQGLVGGLIEYIALSGDLHMYVNEEGKLNDLPFNNNATALLKLERPELNDIILGDAVVVSASEEPE